MVPRCLPLVMFAAVALAGCAAAPLVVESPMVGPVAVAPGTIGTYPLTQQPSGIPISIDVGSARALASLPPEAGPVLAVRETRHANGLTQDITLGGTHSNAGANTIALTELMPPDPAWRGNDEGSLKIAPITDTAIQAELDARFPRIAMAMAPNYETTAQGPLGYAIGKVGPTTCLYAWQNITPSRPINLAEGASGLGDYPIAVRVRLCKAASEAALLDIVRRLSIVRPGYGPVIAPPAMAGPGFGADALAAASAPSVTVAPAAYQAGYGQAPTFVARPAYAGYGASPGAVVVAGPVTATPAGIVVAPPVLATRSPGLGPVLAYDPAPPLNAPVVAPYPGAGAPAETVTRPITQGSRARTRRGGRRHDSLNATVERMTGPAVPLPSEIVMPGPVAPQAPAAAPPAPAAPASRPSAAADDALPMPK